VPTGAVISLVPKEEGSKISTTGHPIPEYPLVTELGVQSPNYFCIIPMQTQNSYI
jgi:hypothetical protein